MWARLKQMLIKEFIQVLRDKRTRMVLIVPPIVQMLIFGYAATLEIKHVSTAIIDFDNTHESRDFIARIEGSPYFEIKSRTLDRDAVRRMIDKGEIVLAVQINSGFAQDVLKGQTASVQAVVDASNSNTALIAVGYVNQIAARFAKDFQNGLMNRTS